MPQAIALIPVDLHRSRLGLPSRVGEVVAGQSVLQHTLMRVGKVGRIEAIVLVHAGGQDPLALIDKRRIAKPVRSFVAPDGLFDAWHPCRSASRKWSPAAWRGGLGNACVYDELLPASPLLAAMDENKATSALLVGGDWMLVDPAWCDKVLEIHLPEPEAMGMVFTQAPPGLAGVAIGRSLVENLAKTHATLGQSMAYHPMQPQADAIGRDVCVQIPASARNLFHRFIYDLPAPVALIQRLAGRLGSEMIHADGPAIASAVNEMDARELRRLTPLPGFVRMEITPRRSATGPIVPQHHVKLDRPDMSVDLAQRVFDQLGAQGDVALVLGGLGDPLLHPRWAEMVLSARRAGVWGIMIETDLLCDASEVTRLLELPIDALSVRMNADTPELYAKVMGVDALKDVMNRFQTIFSVRNRRTAERVGDAATAEDSAAAPGLPWLLPRMIKTSDTLGEMETFFDKWQHYLGHGIIEPATTGCGLMPPQFPVDMAPPRRFACRQLGHRMTILSDGSVALCDQDWLGRASLGNVADRPLAEVWAGVGEPVAMHLSQGWGGHPLCGQCSQWHRP